MGITQRIKGLADELTVQRELGRQPKPKAESDDVMVLYVGSFNSDYNPIVGVVATEDQARQLEKSTTEHDISWEPKEVRDADGAPVDGEPVWLVVSENGSAQQTHDEPDLLDVFATLPAAQAAQQNYIERDNRDVLIWQLTMGAVDLSAPDWSYRG